MSIKPLPGDVVVRIKSSVVITSLNGVVIGLLENSLDADACKINISVDYTRGNCSVEDNGLGIPPRDFRADGGLGQFHHTSKYPPRADHHGRNGDFLASLASLSLLSIASHHHEYFSHNSLTVHNSRVLARDIPALPEQRVLAFSTGTRVTVRDLFGSMPVRVKQRAAETDRIGYGKEFDRLIRAIVALLLAWPGPVSVSLRETSSQKAVTLRTATAETQGTSLNVARIQALFAQATLCDGGQLASWVPIGASAPGVSIAGCISSTPVATKQAQFMSLGIRPLLNEHQFNVLYEDVNRVFANSSFGAAEEDVTYDEKGEPATFAPIRKEISVRKGVDRWPMFYIRITFTGNTSDSLDPDILLDEKHQNLVVITDLLRIAAYQFLKKHHFQPRAVNAFNLLRSTRSVVRKEVARPRITGESTAHAVRPTSIGRNLSGHGSSSRHQTPESRPLSPFAAWPNAKTGSRVMPKKVDGDPRGDNLNLCRGRKSAAGGSTKHRLIDSSGELTRNPLEMVDFPLAKPAPPVPPEAETAGPLGTIGNAARETVEWLDPTAKMPCLVDTRAGFVINSASTRRLTLPPSKPASTGQPKPKPPWLEDILQKWENAVFGTTEPPIPRIPDVTEEVRLGSNLEHHGCLSYGDSGDTASLGIQGRISRQALQSARIIGQMDHKYILARIRSEAHEMVSEHFASNSLARNEGEFLVLVDPHAADERCRLEGLMGSYFTALDPEQRLFKAETEMLDKPLRFELSKKEGDLFTLYSKHFEHWGIFYEVHRTENSARSNSAAAKLEVRSLPPSILERCRIEPRLLVDLLRTEAWKIHDSPSLAAKAGGVVEIAGTNRDWVREFHGCPQGILDLLNSRSCRSAIMFNDRLSMDECADLLQRLTECAFPFQCAHGRPSIIPLLNMGDEGGFGLFSGGGEGENHNSWSKMQIWGKGRTTRGKD